MSVFYALHIHRKSGHQEIEHTHHAELPKLGAIVLLTLRREHIKVRVFDVISK
jgi:hypothetical protein